MTTAPPCDPCPAGAGERASAAAASTTVADATRPLPAADARQARIDAREARRQATLPHPYPVGADGRDAPQLPSTRSTSLLEHMDPSQAAAAPRPSPVPPPPDDACLPDIISPGERPALPATCR